MREDTSQDNSQARERFDEEFPALVMSNNPDAYSVFTFVQQRLRQFRLWNHEPDEILNEVYLRGCKLIESGEEIKKPLAWIRVTALNVIRERSRERDKMNNYTHQVDLIVASSLTTFEVEDYPTDNPNYIALKRALSNMSAKDLDILQLRHGQENLSWKEIGKRLENGAHCSTNPATLRQQGFRALKRLRKLFHSSLEELNVGIR